MRASRKVKIVAVSGGFDPLHIGHVRLFQAARNLGDRLVVILNNDNWLRAKKGFVFMPEKERAEVIKAYSFVDDVYITKHGKNVKSQKEMSVCDALKKIRPDIFASGGDRDKKNASLKSSSLNPEVSLCKKLGTKIVYSVGKGGKVQSSSWMVHGAARPARKTVRPWGEYFGWDTGKVWNLKTIYIKPRKRLSLQYHHHRSECWLLVAGDAVATVHTEKGVEQKVPLKKGETFLVAKGQVHRLESKKGGVVVEVAYGAFDEEDIVRIEDDHGRVGGNSTKKSKKGR